MELTNELKVFNDVSEEFLASNYILADIKIVNLLRAIASSETLVAIMKASLEDFDYALAEKKYLVKSKYLSESKGEYVQPTSIKELLAFTFCLLMDLDSKKLVFSDFLNKYFYCNGSCFEQYSSFLGEVIKPFKDTVNKVVQSIMDGELGDPVKIINDVEEQKAKNIEQQKILDEKDKELNKLSYANSVKELKEILLKDKQKLKNSKIKDEDKLNYILVLDMLANAVDVGDKDSVIYAYTAYSFAVKTKRLFFMKRLKKTKKLIDDILKGI